MAVSNIKKRKIGIALAEGIMLGIRAGARESIRLYRALIAEGRTDEAILQIKRAIDLPHRARTRINLFITNYTQAFLVECITLVGDYTIAELNTELKALETYATGLYNRRIGGESWDSLATDIETHIDNEVVQWKFPLPVGYKDIWGE